MKGTIYQAARALMRTPFLFIVATLTIATGSAGVVCLGSLLYAIALAPLHVNAPQELWRVGDTAFSGVRSGLQGDVGLFSYPLYKILRDSTSGVEGITAFQADPRRIGVRNSASNAPARSSYGEFVSGNYFQTMGVSILAGRPIELSDDKPGAAPVAVLQYDAWRQKFHAEGIDPGRTAMVNGAAVQVVGVAGPRFYGDTLRGSPTEVWLPLASEPVLNKSGSVLEQPNLYWLNLICRIPPGKSSASIQSQLTAEVRNWLRDAGAAFLSSDDMRHVSDQRVRLVSARSGVSNLQQTYSGVLVVMLVLAVLVLLAASANIAMLLQARQLRKKSERDLKRALGCSVLRLAGEASAEAAIIALVGGILSIGLGLLGMRLLMGWVFTASYVPVDTQLSFMKVLIAFASTFSAGIVLAMPAVYTATRAETKQVVGMGSRVTRRPGRRMQLFLIGLQSALGLTVLAVTGLSIVTVRNLTSQSFGFEPHGRLNVVVDPKLAGYRTAGLPALYQELNEQLRSIPGVRNVSWSLYSPLSGGLWSGDIYIDGRPAPLRDGETETVWNRVGPDYFETVGTRVLAGRSITERDNATAKKVAVVNEAFVRRFFPRQNPIGSYFGKVDAKYARDYEIVGVAENAKYRSAKDPAVPMYFVSMAQTTPYPSADDATWEENSHFIGDVEVEVAGSPGAVVPLIKAAFARVDPNLAITRIVSMDEQLTRNISQELMISRICTCFGVMALLLVASGSYAIAAYVASQRYKEFGIRLALGATRSSLLLMVVRSEAFPSVIGLAAGLPVCLLAGKFFRTSLYGVGMYSPGIIAAAITLLVAVSVVAVVSASARVASMHPSRVLRME